MGKKKPKPIQRFFKKIKEEGGCWVWCAAQINSGYGTFYDEGKDKLAHRFSYELFNGQIPDGLDIDHLCRNRLCVNPEHLEAVTRSENLLRGLTGKNNRNAKKTHCPQGHELKEPNLVLAEIKRGYRQCKICFEQYQKSYTIRCR